ncbi:MAG: hypothetical protein WED07_06420 [Candidatus Freyarchaeum deiterrae]
MSYIEEPHFTRTRQRFRFLSLNCDKLTNLVLDAVNSYKDGGFNRPEFFRDIRDRQPIDVSTLDKEFVEELENGAALLYTRGKYRLNMTRVLMLMNMFLKEIEHTDKDRADKLRQNVDKIQIKIKSVTGVAGAPGIETKPKLPEYEEIEKEEPTVSTSEVEIKRALDPIDTALATYIKEYDKLSIAQISSVLGISEDETRQRINYMLSQGLLLGTLEEEYFIQEAVSAIPTPITPAKTEETIKAKEPLTLETTPTEEIATLETTTEPAKVIKEPVVEEHEVKEIKQPVAVKPAVVEKPVAVKPTFIEETFTVKPVVVEKPAVVEKPVAVKPSIVKPVEVSVTKKLTTEVSTVEAVKVAPSEAVTYTGKDVKDIYERLKLFIEMVSQVLEMVIAPEKPGFTMKDLSKLVYDYYFLPIDGSFEVEPFMELGKDGAVRVEKDWIRIDLEKSLSLFKNTYLPGIKKVKKKTAEKLEKALKEHIEQPIENILKQAGT